MNENDLLHPIALTWLSVNLDFFMA